jgi:hypothetical protein
VADADPDATAGAASDDGPYSTVPDGPAGADGAGPHSTVPERPVGSDVDPADRLYGERLRRAAGTSGSDDG